MNVFLDLLLGLIVLVVFLIALTAAYFVRFDVPAVPSPHEIVRAMVEAAQLKEGDRVLDLGAGDGRLLIEAKRQNPGITAIGYEIVPTIWLFGKLRTWWSRQTITFRCADAQKADLTGVSVIFLYVTPEMMRSLKQKFDRELKMGVRIVSHVFALPDRTPVRQVKIPWGRGEKVLRVYEW